MNIFIFQEIHNLHSEWSAMDKSSRLGWLMGKTMRLNGVANQMAQHVWAAGGFLNEAERAYARELLEMIQAVDVEGAKMRMKSRMKRLRNLPNS